MFGASGVKCYGNLASLSCRASACYSTPLPPPYLLLLLALSQIWGHAYFKSQYTSSSRQVLVVRRPSKSILGRDRTSLHRILSHAGVPANPTPKSNPRPRSSTSPYLSRPLTLCVFLPSDKNTSISYSYLSKKFTCGSRKRIHAQVLPQPLSKIMF